MKKFAFILAALLALSANAFANTEDELKLSEQKLNECDNTFQAEDKSCPDKWSMRCYDKLMETNKKAQKCYKQVAVDLFEKYYGLSKKEAEEHFDAYNKFIYEEYLFVFNNTSYCKKNNCGISVYLYSEYAATYMLYLYVYKIIGSISARI